MELNRVTNGTTEDFKTIDPEYKKIIDECAKNRENFIIYNGSPLHAAYLLSKFFEYGAEKVKIFSGRLYEGVYGANELIEKAIDFLKKDGTTLEIIFQNSNFKKEIPQHRLLRRIYEEFGDKMPNKLKIWDASSIHIEKLHHFALMDEQAFRLETDHQKRKAIANFGDKKTAEVLGKVFEVLKKKAQLVSLDGFL
jgi:hypothetical protein